MRKGLWGRECMSRVCFLRILGRFWTQTSRAQVLNPTCYICLATSSNNVQHRPTMLDSTMLDPFGRASIFTVFIRNGQFIKLFKHFSNEDSPFNRNRLRYVPCFNLPQVKHIERALSLLYKWRHDSDSDCVVKHGGWKDYKITKFHSFWIICFWEFANGKGKGILVV